MERLRCRLSRDFRCALHRSAGEEEDGSRKVNEVSDHFGEGRVTVITEEGFEQFTKDRVLVHNGVDIPNMFDDVRDEANFVEFMNAMRHKPGGKENEQIAGDLEKLFQVEASGGSDEGPAQ